MKERAHNFIRNLRDGLQSPKVIPREVRHSDMEQLRNEVRTMQYASDVMRNSDPDEPDYETAGHTMAHSYTNTNSILEKHRLSEFLNLENDNGNIQVLVDPNFHVTHTINSLNIGSLSGPLIHEVFLFTRSLPESVRIQELMVGEPQILFDASHATSLAVQKESAGER